jgi:hypothetical protein
MVAIPIPRHLLRPYPALIHKTTLLSSSNRELTATSKAKGILIIQWSKRYTLASQRSLVRIRMSSSKMDEIENDKEIQETSRPCPAQLEPIADEPPPTPIRASVLVAAIKGESERTKKETAHPAKLEQIEDAHGPEISTFHIAPPAKAEKVLCSTEIEQINDSFGPENINCIIAAAANESLENETRSSSEHRRETSDIESFIHRSERNDAPGNNDDFANMSVHSLRNSSAEAVHVPEAWRVTDDNEEIFIATPLLPWWDREQNRLYTWALLCLFSSFALAAHETEVMTVKSAQQVTITACSSISLLFSAFACVAHMDSSVYVSGWFVGTYFEGALSLILMGLWAGTTAIITNPNNYIGVSWYQMPEWGQSGFEATISNANLFFSSWGAIICALVILAMFVGEQKGRTASLGIGYTVWWCLLHLTSLVLIVESVRFKNENCEGFSDATCSRNISGIAAGEFHCDVYFLLLNVYL